MQSCTLKAARRRHTAAWLSLACALLASACSGDDGGDDGAGQAQSDYELLKACPGELVCDGRKPTGVDDAEGIDSARCVLEALRDRAPGRYHYTASREEPYSWGWESKVLILDGQGGVLTAADGVRDEEPGSTPYSKAAQNCELKPASYFQACLDALETSSFAYGEPECLLEHWFESCTETTAVCE